MYRWRIVGVLAVIAAVGALSPAGGQPPGQTKGKKGTAKAQPPAAVAVAPVDRDTATIQERMRLHTEKVRVQSLRQRGP